MSDSPLREVQVNGKVGRGAEPPVPSVKPTEHPISFDDLPIGVPTQIPFETANPPGYKPAPKPKAGGSSSGAALDLEEMPVGGNSSVPMPDEYPPGYTPPADDSASIASMPLEKRLGSKRWQERRSAYDEIVAAAEADVGSARVAHGSLLPKMIADSNPFAQERAFDALVAFARAAEEVADAERLASASLLGALIEKGLVGRPNVRSRATEAAMLLVEAGAGPAVQASCLKLSAHKVPKVALAATELLAAVLTSFGLAPLDVRSLAKPVAALAETHRDKAVRDAALGALALAKARGGEAAVDVALREVKPATAAEFERICAESAEAAAAPPTRSVRGAALAADAADAADAPGAPAAGAGAVPTAPAVAEVVSAMSKLPKGWAAQLGADKWQARKAALDSVEKGLALPSPLCRLAPKDDYVELVRALKRVVGSDANVACVAAAVRCLALLATGLGADFARAAREVAPLILDKAAEKHRAVSDAVARALDALYGAGAVPLAEACEVAAGGIGSKTPAVRLAAAEWLGRCARAEPPAGAARTGAAAKALAAALLRATDDGQGDVRAAAYASLAAVISTAPEGVHLDGLLAGLDGVKRKALDKALGGSAGGAAAAGSERAQPSAGAAATATAAPPPRPTTAGARPASKSGGAASSKGSARPKTARTARSAAAAGSKPASSAGASGGGGGAKGGGGRAAAAALEAALEAAPAPLLADSDGDARVAAAAPNLSLAALGAKPWRERLEAVDALAAALGGAAGGVGAAGGAAEAGCSAELLDAAISLLGRTPGWKESMAAVGARMAACVGALARGCAHEAHPSTVAKAAPPLAERLADAKQRAAAADALLALAASGGAALVGAHVCRATRAHKNPRVTAEALVWLRGCALAFGARGGGGSLARAPGVSGALADALGHKDVKVREAATGAAVALHRCASAAGSRDGLLPALVSRVSPQTGAALEAAQQREEGAPLPQPTHRARGAQPADADADAAADGGGGVSGASGGQGGAPPSGLLSPQRARVPIASLLPAETLGAMGCAQWKARLAAVSAARDAVRGTRLDPALGPFAEAVRARLGDTNRAVAAAAAELAAELARAMGRPVLQHVKTLGPALLSLLGDARPAPREAAEAALAALVAEVSFEPFIGLGARALSSETGRGAVLKWLASYAPATKPDAHAELRLLLPPALGARAAERAAEPRAHADRLLKALADALGADAVQAAAAELKAADAHAVAPAVQRILSSASALGSADADADADAAEGGAEAEAEDGAAEAASAAEAEGAPPVGEEEAPAQRQAARPATARAPARSGAAPARPRTAGGGSAPPPPGAGMLSANGGKEGRARREAKCRWVHPTESVPSAEAIAMLSEQFAPVASGALHAQLFAPDFRQHLMAIGSLEKELGAAQAAHGGVRGSALADCLDLVARWLALRLSGAPSAAVLAKAAGLIDGLLAALGADGYRLTELEARALLPALTLHLGANAEPTRARFRGLVRGACEVAEPAVVGAALVDAMASSRNARARVEAAECLAWLGARHGIGACAPARSLPLAASHSSAADKRLRDASLALLRVALADGEAWAAHIVAPLGDADARALRDRLGALEPPARAAAPRAAAAAAAAGAGAHAAAEPAPSSSSPPPTPPASARARGGGAPAASNLPVPAAITRVQQQQQQQHAAGAGAGAGTPPPQPSPARRPLAPAAPSPAKSPRVRASAALANGAAAAPPAPSAEPVPAPPLAAAGRRPAAGGARRKSSLPASPLIGSSPAEEAVPGSGAADGVGAGADGLPALLCALLAFPSQAEAERVAALRALVAEVERTPPELLRPHADSAVSALLACLRGALPSAEGDKVGVRWCKHILNAFMTLVKVPGVVRSLSEEGSRSAVHALLGSMILVHAREQQISEGSRMLKALNLLVLRVLDELSRTQLCGTLLSLLAHYSAPQPSEGAEEEASGADLGALVLKSLSKATAALAATERGQLEQADIEPRAVLRHVCAYLRAHEAAAASPASASHGGTPRAPQPGRSALAKRAREHVRALAVEVLRVGGLSAEAALAECDAPDAYVLGACLRGSARTPRSAAHSAAKRAGAEEQQPPSTPLASALAAAAESSAGRAAGSATRASAARAAAAAERPSSARLTRSAARAKAAAEAEAAAAAEPSAPRDEVAADAEAVVPPTAADVAAAFSSPLPDVPAASELAAAATEAGAAGGAAHAADAAGAADAAEAALSASAAFAASASAAESVQARVRRIRELRSKFPTAEVALVAAASSSTDSHLTSSTLAAARSPVEAVSSRYMERLRELKSKYNLAPAPGAGAGSPRPSGAGAGEEDALDPPTPSQASMAALRERLARIKSDAVHLQPAPDSIIGAEQASDDAAGLNGAASASPPSQAQQLPPGCAAAADD